MILGNCRVKKICIALVVSWCIVNECWVIFFWMIISSGSFYARKNAHLNLAAKIGSKTWHYNPSKYFEYFSPKALANGQFVLFINHTKNGSSGVSLVRNNLSYFPLLKEVNSIAKYIFPKVWNWIPNSKYVFLMQNFMKIN